MGLIDNIKVFAYKCTPTQLVGTLNAGNFMVPDTWEHSENCYTDVWGMPASHCVSISRIPVSSSLLISLKDNTHQNILTYLVNKDRYITEKNGGSYVDVKCVDFAGRKARYTKSVYEDITSEAYFYMTETHLIMVSATYKSKLKRLSEYLVSILNTYTCTSTDCVSDWFLHGMPTMHDPIDNIYKCHGLCNPDNNPDDIHLCSESEIYSLFTSIYKSKTTSYRRAACISYIRFLCNKYAVPQPEVYFSDVLGRLGYATETNVVVLHKNYLHDCRTAFRMCAHEFRHLWQFEQIRLHTEIGRLFEDVRKHYAQPEEDFDQYANNLLESDAREFEASEMRGLILLKFSLHDPY